MTTMFGSIRINFVFGFIGLLFTFFVSYSSNLISTSLYRAGTAFVIWFMLAFLCRWVLGYVLAPSPAIDSKEDHDGTEMKGAQLDITAPDDDEALKNILNYPTQEEQNVSNQKKTAAESGFEPLNPPKLVRTKDAEELAKAVRHMSDN